MKAHGANEKKIFDFFDFYFAHRFGGLTPVAALIR
jgi:hypothetical protein